MVDPSVERFQREITAMAEMLAGLDHPGDFAFADSMRTHLPHLVIDGVGQISFPLLDIQADQIKAVAAPAPYGRGPDTIHDDQVRRCWQVDADALRIGPEWDDAMGDILTDVAEGLGLEDIRAELYKLLLYEAGGHFVPHRDTEKSAGMVGTLVVVLPSRFEGGQLAVEHAGDRVEIGQTGEDISSVEFAAFYADCVHQVREVTAGHRLCLVYNLIVDGEAPSAVDYRPQVEQVAAVLRAWPQGAGNKRLYVLEHKYSEAGLSFETLKNGDRAAVAVLRGAAELAECDVQLAILAVEQEGAAEVVSFGRHSYRDDEFEAMEVFEHAAWLEAWVAAPGRRALEDAHPFEPADAMRPFDLDAQTPDSETFYEATGNAGASFDRAYRLGVAVVWPRARALQVGAEAGIGFLLPHLAEQIEADADDVREVAALMLEKWPARAGNCHFAEAVDLLFRLGDERLLDRMACDVVGKTGYTAGSASAVVRLASAVSEPAVAAIVNATEALAGRQLSACVALLDDVTGVLQLRCLEATVRGFPEQPERAWFKSPVGVTPESLSGLLRHLEGAPESLVFELQARLEAHPELYPLDGLLGAALLELGGVEAQAGGVLAIERSRYRDHLNARIEAALEPPKDWRRPAVLRCDCGVCRELVAFLAADLESARFPLRKELRRHARQVFEAAKADVDTHTIRRGRPFTLMCTKNQASFERRVAQREADLEALAALDPAREAG